MSNVTHEMMSDIEERTKETEAFELKETFRNTVRTINTSEATSNVREEMEETEVSELRNHKQEKRAEKLKRSDDGMDDIREKRTEPREKGTGTGEEGRNGDIQ